MLGDDADSPRYIRTIPRRRYRFIAPRAAASSDEIFLAVLPLESFSSDSGQEYFADGLTEELITELTHISAMKVISRTSLMRYKKSRKT